LTTLKKLWLINSLDLNEELIYITGLLNLECLDLSYSFMSTEELHHLSELTKLETLNLRECKITMEEASLKLSLLTSFILFKFLDPFI